LGEAVELLSGGLRLAGYLARPPATSAPGGGRHGLIVCHGFPTDPGGAAVAGGTNPGMADRVAAERGWVVLTFNFRGTGASQGDFSMAGWLEDVANAVDFVLAIEGVEAVWSAGFGVGASLCICEAAADERIRGVAAFGAAADFGDWASDPRRFVTQARMVGVIHGADFPSDLYAWARELREIRPLSAVAKIPPRPLLLVHGADDTEVPLIDARSLADAASPTAELRILPAADHRLRHDPRVIAILLGWLDRQTG
jgi:alpha/beta superfamily hydrolase